MFAIFVWHKGLSPDHAADGTVSSLDSLDNDQNPVLVSSGLDLGELESKLSGEIFVQDGDLAFSVIAEQSLLGLWIVELNVEIQVRLPVVVVVNCDIDRLFLIFLLHGDDLVECFELFAGHGAIRPGSDSEACLCVLILLPYGDRRCYAALRDGVVQAFEGEELTLMLYWSCCCVFHLELLSLDLQEFFTGTDLVGFPCSKSFEERLRLQLVHELFKANRAEIIGTQNLHVQVPDLLRLLFRHSVLLLSLSGSEYFFVTLLLCDLSQLNFLTLFHVFFHTILFFFLLFLFLVVFVGAEREC